MLVVLENQQLANILGSQNAPNITKLTQSYPIATQYFATTHPSLPNYLELWAGATFGITDDGLPAAHPLTGQNLGSQLDASGIEWAGYFESLLAGEDPTVNQGPRDSKGSQQYQAHHNPIVYFSGYEPGRVRPYTSLFADLDSPTPPSFALVVPDMVNDMHDPVGSTSQDATAVKDGDLWIQALLDRVCVSNWWKSGGTVLLVWDEAYDGSGHALPDGIGSPPTTGGPVLLIVMSAVLSRPRPYQFGLGGDGNWDQPLTHAGLLASIETYFGLPLINDASNATYGNISPVLISSTRQAAGGNAAH
jgi:phosphatidylinositol-3-phosphatase